uniref:Microsomal glutathione S-transferase 3a n=1 Tax=Astyanax mexicanus TaxID=7994 RepID=A0A3B1K2W3_ASTMX
MLCISVPFTVSAIFLFLVQYPKMYSDDPANNISFYSNEILPLFLFFLTAGGIHQSSDGLGAIWIVSRLVYAHGYSSGDPAKRKRGAFGDLALLGLVFCTVDSGRTMLGWGCRPKWSRGIFKTL